MNWRMTVAYAVAALAASLALPGYAAAADYPDKPIRMVCPFPPGGTTDFVARMIAQKLSEAWGQEVVVDNRPGAGGIIGTEMVAKAAPDGYTVLLGSITTHAINPALYAHMNYDPIKDFQPVTLAVSSPQVLVVHPAVPARSLAEFIALAKAQPGKLNYASSGIGTSPNVTFEMFKSMAGINVIHVPYKGTGPANTDLVGGHVQAMISGIAALMPYIKSGQMRPLAVTTKARAPALPALPTFDEAGVPDFDVSSWFGVFLPAHTPPTVVSKMNREIRRIVADPEVRRLFIEQGADPSSNTPEEFTAFVKSEKQRWGKVIKDARIQGE
ncbi:tripartite tricarboxylate transporter substrate binding protein [Pigmentiphaga soli]|uniref:Tripartite tricarboxylate transporter substrate binding protein n=1 Tax=Pigmentiphaga soli TaxID=1007095 RepID=A0ABP8GWR4_9BURK